MRAFLLCLLILLPLTLAGCSGKTINESDPAALFQDAEDELKGDHYQIAIDKFRVIKNKFPYSKYSIEAQLRIADVYFMQDSFAEAASAYEAFRDLHPKHERAPYATFRIGKSYFNDTPTNVARDLTPAQKSLEAYGEFVSKYPNAPEAADARKDMADLRKLLAEKELYIGDFYLKRGNLESAVPRYQRITQLYGDTAVAKEAEKKLAEAAERAKKQGASQ